jgi:hypothetical protein
MATLIKDDKGYELTRDVLIERLTCLEVYYAEQAFNDCDYSWAANIFQDGYKGYNKMSDDELVAEWTDSQDGFWNMVEAGVMPYQLLEDPMTQKETV